MWRSYFADRNYRVFYLHSFGDSIATRLTQIFTGAFLYSSGMPLHFIFLFLGLEFGLRGVLAPLGPALFSKIGLVKTVYLSYVLLIVYFILVGSAGVSLSVAFSAFIFHAFGRAIYYPCIDSLHALLVHEESRGRQNSIEIALMSLAGLVAVGLGTVVLTFYSFWMLAVIVAVILLITGGIVSWLDGVTPVPVRVKDSYTYLASQSFRPYLLPLGAYSLAIIANIFAAPLLIFISVGNIEVFGLVVGAALTVELLVVLAAGAVVDRYHHTRTAFIVVALQSIGNIGYLFLKGNPLQAFAINAFNTNAWNALRNNFETRVQREAKRSGSALLFMTAGQMTLCFVEVVALSAFALIAYWHQLAVFPVVFIASVVGLWIAERTLFGRDTTE